MKNRKLAFYRPTLILAGISLLFTLAVLCLDRRPGGPSGTVVGLAFLNLPAARAIGYHAFWYRLTQGLGVFALLVCACFAGLGLFQWKTRGAFRKVDPQILLLGALYAVTLFLYIAFDKIALNYRPLIMPGETVPEASFPSSHCLLIVVVMGSTLLMSDHYLKDPVKKRIAKALCLLLAAVTVLGRLLSGVHWLTDIAAGVLISLTLLSAFKRTVQLLAPKK